MVVSFVSLRQRPRECHARRGYTPPPMSQVRALVPPAADVKEVAAYVANPRAKRSFNTILDANELFDANGRSQVTTTVSGAGAGRRVTIETRHALRGGTIAETFELAANGHLSAVRL